MRWPVQTWHSYRRVKAQGERINEVMARLEVDTVAAVRKSEGTALTQARTNCVRCRFDQQCRNWIDASLVLSAPPIFCLNTQFFGEFRTHAR